MAQFELYRDSADDFRWRLRADNGNVVADSGQGYSRRTDCERGIEIVKEQASGAEVIDQVEDRR
jgi:uncharacterized protein YegP (UPF0339 family)